METQQRSGKPYCDLKLNDETMENNFLLEETLLVRKSYDETDGRGLEQNGGGDEEDGGGDVRTAKKRKRGRTKNGMVGAGR